MVKASSVHPYERGQRTGIKDRSRQPSALKRGGVGPDVGEGEGRSL